METANPPWHVLCTVEKLANRNGTFLAVCFL